MTSIDERAVIHESVRFGEDVTVGPFAIIGPNVVIGRGTTVAGMALVEKDTVIGEECVLGHSAVVGTDPQDLKYHGEKTHLVIGDRTTVREFATINRATGGEGDEPTRVGSDTLIMAYAHVAHNCDIGDHVVITNAVNLAGHVIVEDYAIIGGMTAVQQFVHIGMHSYVGGACRVTKDVPPYLKIGGVPTRPIEMNTVGLMRRGYSEEALNQLRKAYRHLYLSDLNTTQALERIRAELPANDEITRLVAFIEGSTRGIIK
ncbi:MAG: acyl-ACP--UDP-N-acetylglucosamine O-acyltransferase [Candidatus Eisenbacteria bacterium]|jgi:UDP-N-acetylglucosamine acyltransferase